MTLRVAITRVMPDAGAVFGSLDQARLLGLAGDPAAVLANWLALGRPLIDSLQDRVTPRLMVRAQLVTAVDKRHPYCELLGAVMSSSGGGALLARPQSLDDPDALRAAIDCSALIVLTAGRQHFAVGSIVEVLPFQ